MLGLGARSHTAQNLLREKECVLNLPSIGEVAAVNRLARLTGSDPVPPHKVAMGYHHEKDKLGAAGLSGQSVGPRKCATRFGMPGATGRCAGEHAPIRESAG